MLFLSWFYDVKHFVTESKSVIEEQQEQQSQQELGFCVLAHFKTSYFLDLDT